MYIVICRLFLYMDGVLIRRGLFFKSFVVVMILNFSLVKVRNFFSNFFGLELDWKFLVYLGFEKGWLFGDIVGNVC